MDEISLILTPAADGSTDAVTVFERSPLLEESRPAHFHLKRMERLEGDAVWLVYDTDSRRDVYKRQGWWRSLGALRR